MIADPYSSLHRTDGLADQRPSAWLARRADLHPQREAVVVGDRRVTYAELGARAERLAAALRHEFGLAGGDRVATLLSNGLEYLDLLFATATIGAILVPLNWRLAPAEIAYQLRDCGPRALFVGPEHGALADAATAGLPIEQRIDLGPTYDALVATTHHAAHVNVALDAPHCILYTSGTTGSPKGAVLTHSNLLFNSLNFQLGLDLTARDTTLTVLPMFHAGGISLYTLPTLYVGGRVVIAPAATPAAILAALETEQVTTFFAVPTIWQDLLRDPSFTADRFPAVRALGSGGAPCPRFVVDELTRRGFIFLQGYGLTETSPGGTFLTVDDWRAKSHTVGKPLLHTRLRVVDDHDRPVGPEVVGEVQFRGPNVFAGYWGQPQATADAFTADGWLRTGDLGVLDADGYLRIVDRKKDLIISGGENVYAAEVEAVLLAHPAIADAAVIGLPHDRWGEAPLAIVVLHPGMAAFDDDIIAFCRERLAKYKTPVGVVYTDALPRTASLKVMKAELRRRYAPPPRERANH